MLIVLPSKKNEGVDFFKKGHSPCTLQFCCYPTPPLFYGCDKCFKETDPKSLQCHFKALTAVKCTKFRAVTTLNWKYIAQTSQNSQNRMYSHLSNNKRLIQNLLNSHLIICLLHKALYTIAATNHQGRMELSHVLHCSKCFCRRPCKQYLMKMD